MSDINPKVTVLMPVYNGEEYLKEAIDSILGQTFTDFEFLIINDGSTDRTEEIIKSYKDKRIILVNNEMNLKLINTLNKGLGLSRGEYIARMDSDDISIPDRLKIQVEYMDKHLDVGVCGGWIELFGGADNVLVKNPENHKEIVPNLLFSNVIAHPSVMIRNGFLKKFNLEYPHYEHAEDWAFWKYCSRKFLIVNIPVKILSYRISGTSVSQRYTEAQSQTIKHIMREGIEELGVIPDQNEIDLHYKISQGAPISTRRELLQASEWLNKLRKSNITDLYDRSYFYIVLSQKWFNACYSANRLGLWSYMIFVRNNFQAVFKISGILQMKFILKCILSYLKREE